MLDQTAPYQGNVLGLGPFGEQACRTVGHAVLRRDWESNTTTPVVWNDLWIRTRLGTDRRTRRQGRATD
jgi:hypothetical protein